MIVTNKTLKKLGENVYESKGSKVSDFARKQMEKMGWKEGDGLGREGNGIVNHIKITKREDTLGLGAEDTDNQLIESITDVWWAGAFDKVAQNIKGKKNSNKKEKKEKKNKKDKKKDKKDKKSNSKEDSNEIDEDDSKDKSNNRNKRIAASSAIEGINYDELFKATGGARPGMRARSSQSGKWARTENM